MLSRMFRRTKETEKDLKRKIVGEEIKDIQKKRFLLQLLKILLKMKINLFSVIISLSIIRRI